MMSYPDIALSDECSKGATLAEVTVKGEINEIFTIIKATQTYKNTENTNIESVYTFPLPSDATLLSFSASIGTRRYVGVVAKKADAEYAYERAIESGDSAVMLENPSPGLYTANFGNLMPGEKATICFTYVRLNEWTHEGLRFYLPTTIAPRYGNPLTAGLQEHQAPEFSLAQENGMRITVSAVGKLSESDISSPSHRVTVNREAGKAVVTAVGSHSDLLVMDRDFILLIKPAEPVASSAFYEHSDDSFTVMASLKPEIPALESPASRCVSLVIDCSASMTGDSIQQARAALQTILQTLRPCDYFNLIRFGSTHRKLFASPKDRRFQEHRHRAQDCGQYGCRPRRHRDSQGAHSGARLPAAGSNPPRPPAGDRRGNLERREPDPRSGHTGQQDIHGRGRKLRGGSFCPQPCPCHGRSL